MELRYETRDLFTVPSDYYLCHCISADFALGAGIAVEFKNRYDMRNRLIQKYPKFYEMFRDFSTPGFCITIDNVFNLVTKLDCWGKPTYLSLKVALLDMRIQADKLGIKKIAMPRIGCGLDRLMWASVEKIIYEIFGPTDIEILVCSLGD